MLVEEDAVLEPDRIEVFAADVVVAARGVGITFELADHRAGMDVIDAGEPHPLGNDAEGDAHGCAVSYRWSGPARCKCRIISFLRAHFAIDWMAV